MVSGCAMISGLGRSSEGHSRDKTRPIEDDVNSRMGHNGGKRTTHEAAGRSLEDAGAFQALWVGAGGAHARLQQAGRQPAGQPLELAVAQETVALDETEKRGPGRQRPEGSGTGSALKNLNSQTPEVLHLAEGLGLDGADGVVSQVPVGHQTSTAQEQVASLKKGLRVRSTHRCSRLSRPEKALLATDLILFPNRVLQRRSKRAESVRLDLGPVGR